MKYHVSMIWLLAVLVAGLSLPAQAGGRYQDPPEFINEVVAKATDALEAIKKDDYDTAMSALSEARNLAKESNKMKTTAPMQLASGELRMAKAALRKKNTDKAVAHLEKVIPYLNKVIESYQ